ncbi:uncharacterized protein [Amphiura filiformis]|uniref:uncharacterized protein isoform X1 n=1 Tax=Amphiura filiformis TaxID=82378 RepID=UPI003B214B3B
MNNNQRVLVCSLAMILCLVVATVTANEADEAKAAALLAEMLYPEYANSPEIQALQKRTPSSSKCTLSSCPTRKNLDAEFQIELPNEKQLLETEKRGAPSCTGIPGLDILGCGEAKRAPSAIPGLDLLGRVRNGKRGAPPCTGLYHLDILGCREGKRSLEEPTFQFPESEQEDRDKRGRCTGIPALDILGCGEAKRTPSAIPGLDLLGRVRNGKRGAPSCTGIPGLDILGCGEVKRASRAPLFDLLESMREAWEKRGAPSCTGIPGLDILGCGEAKRTPPAIPGLDLLGRVRNGKRGAPSCTGIPGLDILGCGEVKRAPGALFHDLFEKVRRPQKTRCPFMHWNSRFRHSGLW